MLIEYFYVWVFNSSVSFFIVIVQNGFTFGAIVELKTGFKLMYISKFLVCCYFTILNSTERFVTQSLNYDIFKP